MKTYTTLILCAATAVITSSVATAQVVQTTAYDAVETTPEFDRPDPSKALAELRGTVQSRPISLLLTAMDRDFDKIVTREELREGITREWRDMEPSFSQKVGAIKFSIWSERTLGSTEALPSRLSFDADLDNQISKDEFTARLMASFNGLDENKDGALSRAELIFIAPRGGRPAEQRQQQREQRDQTGRRPRR